MGKSWATSAGVLRFCGGPAYTSSVNMPVPSRFARSLSGLAVCGCFAVGFAPTNAGAAPSPGKTLHSQTGGKLGLGLMLGQPTGLSGKYFLSREHALAAAFGWGFQYGGRLHLDYAWHPGSFFEHDVLDVIPYVGAGVGVATYAHHAHPWRKHHVEHEDWNHVHGSLFVRLPVLGTVVHWQEIPLDTFVEVAWAPGVVLGHGAQFSPWAVDWAIGARWYF